MKVYINHPVKEVLFGLSQNSTIEEVLTKLDKPIVEKVLLEDSIVIYSLRLLGEVGGDEFSKIHIYFELENDEAYFRKIDFCVLPTDFASWKAQLTTFYGEPTFNQVEDGIEYAFFQIKKTKSGNWGFLINNYYQKGD